MQSPLKAIMDVKRKELPLALMMFLYFFLVISCFWILKPLKKALFIEYYDQTGVDVLSWTGRFSWHLLGSQAELLAKVLNMIIAFLAVTVFTILAGQFRRQQLTLIFTALFMAMFVLYGRLISSPQDGTVWTFYLFGDLFSTLMVATFFAFLNDSVTPSAAKRLYGLVGLGGVVGGFFGSTFVRVWVERISASQWMWICFGIVLVIAVVSVIAGKIVSRGSTSVPDPEPSDRSASEAGAHGKAVPSPRAAAPKRVNPAIEGARLVFRSPYLLSIVAIVGFYEIASTIMDFQFTATIEHYLTGDDIGRQFSTMYAITNTVSMLVQFFLTSFIMTRFGVTTALIVLPAAITMGASAFMIAPILWIGSFLTTADNGFAYSINQSAKEVLYVPTTRDEKYKAKAFIDMFVQRFAKALAVGVSLVITTVFDEFDVIRYLSIATLLIMVVWIIAARHAGKTFSKRSS